MTIFVEELKELLQYDEETGRFTYLVSTSARAQQGKEAGSDNHGYIMITIRGKRYMAHRLAWLYVNGDMPNGEIDHINGIRGDNRICNLRVVSKIENQRNMKLREGSKTDISGVTRSTVSKGWHATISNKKLIQKNFYDKDFGNKEDSFVAAVKWRKEQESLIGYHKNHGRQA